jgi:hypothetical protein
VARPNCGPAAGKTLAHSPRGRLYVNKRSVYGCLQGKRPVRFGGEGGCPESAHLGPFALAGTVAAYALRTCGVDTAAAQVVVRRLSDGHQLSAHHVIDVSPGPESLQSVGSIVVRSSGDVGWIGSSTSIAAHRSLIEVLAWSGGAVRRLDRGSDIRSGSLRLAGPKLTWQHGRTRRFATLG